MLARKRNVDTTRGEVVKTTLKHEDNNVRQFYGRLPRAVTRAINLRRTTG